MLGQDYFTLRLVRLKVNDTWAGKQEGYTFLFPTGGGGTFPVGKATERLAPGDVLLLSEGAATNLIKSDGTELVFWCFSLKLEHLFPLFESYEISMLQNFAEGINDSKFYPASTDIARQCHKLLEDVPPQFNLGHRSQLLRVAACILGEEFKSLHKQHRGLVRGEEHLVAVFEKLTSDELLKFTVGELAARFGCSRRHLNRLFHQYFGLSVAALRMEMRLLKAISLLRDNRAKIIHVAEKCGFNHLGLFNSCFKRRFGVSPGQWRKKTLAIENSSSPSHGDAASCPLRTKGLCPMVENGIQPISLRVGTGDLAEAAIAKSAHSPTMYSAENTKSPHLLHASILAGKSRPATQPIQS